MHVSTAPLLPDRPRAIVIGAGVAGLAAALRLAVAGRAVTLLERHGHAGGKIRTLPSAAGPVDAGPTVLTLRHVFDDLFACAGTRLDDHVTLIRQQVLARHFWPDGSSLDLHADPLKSRDAIAVFAGHRAAEEFTQFNRRTERLFDAFDAPVMQAAHPSLRELVPHVLKRPALIPAMAPLSTLRQSLLKAFSDPRLVQLFGRYATYVGGAPHLSPALLALIWQAEAGGVWVVEGGMHRLAEAIARLCRQQGVDIRYDTHVDRIVTRDGRATGVETGGQTLEAEAILYAGDPRALATGSMGTDLKTVAPQTATLPRSFSARVHSFAATPKGRDLAHHNVFFAADPDGEFTDLAAGRIPADPTLYLCAEDRGQTHPAPELERFEIISNAPASPEHTPQKELD
jgi:1-hydroxycarotenoid 3,4-desaturase